MPRSSETVGALATALAKAQAELVNPEKSLTATLQTEGRGEVHQTFRYAPLSSGLEIVRKTLGGHEIAVVQTTAVDQATGTINLTTMLAHASGEWIASDWPVCQVADLATPRRMGAALTYARRYALFTLVGIAGEDDNDAPEISVNKPTSVDRLPVVEGTTLSNRKDAHGSGRRKFGIFPKTPVLDPDKSMILRDQLLEELAKLGSNDDVKACAQRILKDKNTLVTEDARLVEAAFELKLIAITHRVCETERPSATSSDAPGKCKTRHSPASRVDKSTLQFGEPRRYRNKLHLKFVTSQPCLICGRLPSDAHHLRHVQRRALGRKVSDEFTVPLCRTHHREVHRSGNERAWWRAAKIDPTGASRRLWELTRLSATRSGSDVRGGPIFRDRMAAWLRWILGSITPPISPRLPA